MRTLDFFLWFLYSLLDIPLDVQHFMAFFRSLRKFFILDRLVLALILCAIVLNAAAWAFILWKVHGNAEWRATGYSVYFGITDYGPPEVLFRVPAIGSLFVVVNIVLAYFLHKRSQPFARILLGATAFLQILVIIPLIAIYYIGNIGA